MRCIFVLLCNRVLWQVAVSDSPEVGAAILAQGEVNTSDSNASILVAQAEASLAVAEIHVGLQPTLCLPPVSTGGLRIIRHSMM
jgi:hypothetical protein